MIFFRNNDYFQGISIQRNDHFVGNSIQKIMQDIYDMLSPEFKSYILSLLMSA